MPTNDERREVAEILRSGVGTTDYMSDDDFIDWVHGVVSRSRDGHILDRLADFIDPDELTCHMVFDHLTDTAFCDVCGERFDGVAQYMAMVPNGFSLADYKAKYKDANFCPNCGAKVLQE